MSGFRAAAIDESAGSGLYTGGSNLYFGGGLPAGWAWGVTDAAPNVTSFVQSPADMTDAELAAATALAEAEVAANKLKMDQAGAALAAAETTAGQPVIWHSDTSPVVPVTVLGQTVVSPTPAQTVVQTVAPVAASGIDPTLLLAGAGLLLILLMK